VPKKNLYRIGFFRR